LPDAKLLSSPQLIFQFIRRHIHVAQDALQDFRVKRPAGMNGNGGALACRVLVVTAARTRKDEAAPFQNANDFRWAARRGRR